jgi:hypothetical protein
VEVLSFGIGITMHVVVQKYLAHALLSPFFGGEYGLLRARCSFGAGRCRRLFPQVTWPWVLLGTPAVAAETAVAAAHTAVANADTVVAGPLTTVDAALFLLLLVVLLLMCVVVYCDGCCCAPAYRPLRRMLLLPHRLVRWAAAHMPSTNCSACAAAVQVDAVAITLAPATGGCSKEQGCQHLPATPAVAPASACVSDNT